jgi:hypothetical protein
MGGSSSVGRASAFQADCREFESRLPLHFIFEKLIAICSRSSGVERILGKDEGVSSNLTGSLEFASHGIFKRSFKSMSSKDEDARKEELRRYNREYGEIASICSANRKRKISGISRE